MNARATLDAIRDRDADILEDEDFFHETMIATLTVRREGNLPIVDRLHTAFSVALLALLLELGGLALAAAPKKAPEPLPPNDFLHREARRHPGRTTGRALADRRS